MFTSTAFGRSAYVEVEKQDDVKKSLLLNDEDYYSDKEDVGFMHIPARKYRLNDGKLEIERDGGKDDRMFTFFSFFRFIHFKGKIGLLTIQNRTQPPHKQNTPASTRRRK